MTLLEKLKLLLDNPDVSDDVLTFYLENASDIICDIRNSSTVELKYQSTQLKIAVELFNKRGAEGETGHNENGINRSYEKSDVSESLLNQITPFVRTPFSDVRSI